MNDGRVASKAAIVQISEALAIYLRPKNIGVTLLCPGPVLTNIVANLPRFGSGAPMRLPGDDFELLDPATVGELVADAILANRFYVPTHPQVRDLLRRRVEDWEPSQEDEDLAAAFLGQAEEPLPADGKGLAAAAAGPSSQERAAGLAPPLQVQAGMAMAKAVALQQWLETEEARRTRGRRRRLLLNVAAGLVLLLAGIGIGMAIGSDQPQQVSPPATPQPVVQIRDAAPPAACSQAMDDADAVISYLVAKIRDERLSKSIQDYGANARACRRTVRSP